MIRNILLILSISAIGYTHAQTKLVAHRSHSGKMSVFKTSLYEDNLGWVGVPTIHEPIDTGIFLQMTTDTLTGFPYCNNPNASPDSVAKEYPFYSTTMQDTLTPAQKKEDSLAKPKEHIQSRGEIEKKQGTSKSQEFYGIPLDPPNPGGGFLLGIIAFTLLIGSLIWMYYRKRITTH